MISTRLQSIRGKLGLLRLQISAQALIVKTWQRAAKAGKATWGKVSSEIIRLNQLKQQREELRKLQREGIYSERGGL